MKLSKNGFVVASMASIPFVWAAGLTPFFFQFVAAVLFFSGRGRVGFPLPVWIFSAVYFISILANSVGADGQRIIASLYNLTYWVSGAVVAGCVAKSLLDGHHWFQKAQDVAAGLLIVMAAVSLLGLVSGVQSELVFNSLLGKVVGAHGLPELLRDSMLLKFYVSDWVFEATSRLAVFSPYGNACAGMAVALLTVSTLNDKAFGYRFIILFFSALLVVYSSASRSGAGVLLAFAMMSIFLDAVARPYRIYLFFILTVLSIMLMLAFMGSLIGAVDYVMSVREGSGSVRFATYNVAINTALSQNPILGIGVKPRVEEYFIPIGSHSTFIGVFLKTGVVGLSVILIWQLGFLVKLMKAVGGVDAPRFMLRALAFLVASMPFLAFEDLDAPQFYSFLYFYIVGVYGAGLRRKNNA